MNNLNGTANTEKKLGSSESQLSDLLCFEHDSWIDGVPTRDGDYFYNGKAPNGETLLTIVQITTDPENIKWASTFIPPFWRGNLARKQPTVIFSRLEEWKGEWSGLEFGLCAVEV